jgi:hypothetical protein
MLRWLSRLAGAAWAREAEVSKEIRRMVVIASHKVTFRPSVALFAQKLGSLETTRTMEGETSAQSTNRASEEMASRRSLWNLIAWQPWMQKAGKTTELLLVFRSFMLAPSAISKQQDSFEHCIVIS